MTAVIAALAAEPYVLLTTYRGSGAPVPTAVWVVRDGDELLVTTLATSGKVRRLLEDPRVEVVACDIRGTVPEGAEAVPGIATIDRDAATRERLDAALDLKYGPRYREVRAAREARLPDVESVAVRIALTTGR